MRSSWRTADGERVLYTVDRLTVATAGGGRVLRFSTTPDVPAGVASVLVSRQDYWEIQSGPGPALCARIRRVRTLRGPTTSTMSFR